MGFMGDKLSSNSKIAGFDHAHFSNNSSDESRTPLYFADKTRFLIILLSTLCLASTMANALALNFTVICMVEENPLNSTIVEPMYSESQQSWLFSAIALGTIVGTVPVSYFSGRVGVRKTFTVYGIVSAIATLCTPLAASVGFGVVFVARFLQGFAIATSFPAMGSIIASWSTVKRSGTYVAWLSCHLQLGSIFTMPVAGELCDSRWGWPALYYIQGVATLVLFSLFYFFYRDTPAEHRYGGIPDNSYCRNVSAKELQIIQKDKADQRMDKSVAVPYREMFTDWAVLGCVLSCLSSNLGYNVFIQYGPLYLNKVLEFDVQRTGFAAAAPSIICIFVKFLAGPCSDKVPGIHSAKWRVILFATVSQFCMAGCFVGLAFLPAGHGLLAQTLFTGAIVSSGLNCVGVIKSCQLISGRFSYVIMAVHSFTNSCTVLLLPAFVAIAAPDNTREQWARILVFIAALVIAAILFFDLTAEGTPRQWAIADSSRLSSNSSNSSSPSIGKKTTELDAEIQRY